MTLLNSRPLYSPVCASFAAYAVMPKRRSTGTSITLIEPGKRSTASRMNVRRFFGITRFPSKEFGDEIADQARFGQRSDSRRRTGHCALSAQKAWLAVDDGRTFLTGVGLTRETHGQRGILMAADPDDRVEQREAVFVGDDVCFDARLTARNGPRDGKGGCVAH